MFNKVKARISNLFFNKTIRSLHQGLEEAQEKIEAQYEVLREIENQHTKFLEKLHSILNEHADCYLRCGRVFDFKYESGLFLKNNPKKRDKVIHDLNEIASKYCTYGEEKNINLQYFSPSQIGVICEKPLIIPMIFNFETETEDYCFENFIAELLSIKRGEWTSQSFFKQTEALHSKLIQHNKMCYKRAQVNQKKRKNHEKNTRKNPQ